MNANTVQSKKVNEKLLIGAVIAMFCLMALPSIFILAKVAIGLAMLSLGIIAFKVTLKAMFNTLEQGKIDKNNSIQYKVANITVGLMSMLVGGLSLLIMAKTGLIAVCAAFTALVLHEYFQEEKEAEKKKEKDGFVDMAEESEPAKSEENSGCINEEFDKIAGGITDFCVSRIEEFIPSKSRQV